MPLDLSTNELEIAAGEHVRRPSLQADEAP
jgi:hypothetical protein